MKNPRMSFIVVLALLGTASASAAAVVSAWTEPSVAPTSGSINAPLNTGGTLQTKSGALRLSGELQGTMASGYGQVRMVAGNYGAFWRNDGSNTYLLFTNSGDQYGQWNGLRPFYVNNSSGTVSLGAGALNVLNGGNVGVGTGSPWAKLAVQGKAAFSRDGVTECCNNDATITLGEDTAGTGKKASISFHNAGVHEGTLELAPSGERRFRIYDNQGALMGLEATGNIRAAAFYYTSDANLKKNIKPIENGLEDIGKLKGVYFNWKKTGEPSMGLIAQDVEKVFPEAVTTDAESGFKSVDYGKMVAPLIEAVKSQQKEIEELKARVNELESKEESFTK